MKRLGRLVRRLGSKVNLTSWVSEEVRLEKGQEERRTGREETAKRAKKKGGRREEKTAKGITILSVIPKKIFLVYRWYDEGLPFICLSVNLTPMDGIDCWTPIRALCFVGQILVIFWK